MWSQSVGLRPSGRTDGNARVGCARARVPRSPRPRTRVTREAVKRARSVTAAQVTDLRGSRKTLWRTRFSTRRPREQDRGTRARAAWTDAQGLETTSKAIQGLAIRGQ